MSFGLFIFEAIVWISIPFFAGSKLRGFCGTKLIKIAGKKREKRLEGPNFTFAICTEEQNWLRESETERICQIFWTGSSILLLGNADLRVLNLFQRVINNLSTIRSSFWLDAVFHSSAVGKNRKERFVTRVLETQSPQEIFQLFQEVHFVDELQSKKK